MIKPMLALSIVLSASVAAAGAPAPAAVEALVALRQYFDSTPRERSPVEAPWESTRQLTELEFAWAFARVGDSERAKEIAAGPLAALHGDPLREAIGKAYALRIEQALHHDDQVSLRDHGVLDEVLRLEPFPQYRALRTINCSQALSPWEGVDAITGYWKKSNEGETSPPLYRRTQLEFPDESTLLAALSNVCENPYETLHVRSGQLRAAARLGLPAVLKARDQVLPSWATTTDSFNTNDYWCISVVEFVDALTFAIAESVNPLTRPDPSSLAPPEAEQRRAATKALLEVNRRGTWRRWVPSSKWLLLALIIGGGGLRMWRSRKRGRVPAADALLRDDVARARELLGAELARRPRSAQALFLLACAELREGRIADARSAAQKLREAKPNLPEQNVLDGLIDARAKNAEESWLTAFLEAWRRAAIGAPTPSLLKVAPDATTPALAGMSAVGTADTLVLMLALETSTPAAQFLALRTAIAVSAQPAPMGIKLAALSVLTTRASPETAAEALQASKQIVEDLDREEPGAASIQLWRALLGTDGAFTEPEVRTLIDSVRSAPRFAPEFGPIFESFRSVLARFDPGSASERAFQSSVTGYACFPATIINTRAAVTSDQPTRLRLASFFEVLATRFGAGTTVLDIAIARLFAQRSAEITSDPHVSERAAALARDVASLRSRSEKLAFAQQFAIAPLSDEVFAQMANDEVGFLRRLPFGDGTLQ